MFTGIVEEIGTIVSLNQAGGDNALTVSCSVVTEGTRIGDSINVNGVCLTVTGFTASQFSVNLQPVTLRLSNLGLLRTGSKVNLERALAAGQRMGGHYVQGHVDDTGRVVSVRGEGGSQIIRMTAPSEVQRYVVERGFIAVDGASLTVMDVHDDGFSVSLVYHTQQNINLTSRQPGELVNLEVDVLAKYVERLLGPINESRVDMNLLRRTGFA